MATTWIGDNGNDYFDGLNITYILWGLGGDDILGPKNGNDIVYAASGNDTVFGEGGNDTVYGGTGNDDIEGNNGNDVLLGEAGHDTINGGSGNDAIWGGSGNDLIDGGAGSDVMYGGAGNDIFIVDNSSDNVIEFQGQGLDLVRSSLESYEMSGHIESLHLIGNAYNGTGNNLNNAIVGNPNNNNLLGRGGNDTIHGYQGNDFIDGGTGVDEMIGGTGNDTFVVNSSSDTVTEDGNHGTDLVRSYLTNYYLSANIENLLLIPNSSARNGYGNSLNNGIGGNGNNNTIMGLGGNDVISGLNGNDYLLGGDGDDIIYGGSGNDNMSGGGYTFDSGEIDNLYGQGGGDRFILGSVAYGAHYRGSGLAIIHDFNRLGGDKVLLRGSSRQYTLVKNSNVTGGAGLDTIIRRNGDWIGVIADSTSFNLSSDVTYL